MTGGSQQLRIFRLAMREHGDIARAAEAADFSMTEARLTVEADAKDPPPEEAFVLLAARKPEAAGCAVTTDEETIMPKHDAPLEDDEPNDPLIDLASDTLRGDVRDSILAWFKAQPKAWPFLSEREQRDLADSADRFAEQMTKQACQIIAANERPCIVAKLVEYKEKDGVTAQLKLASTGANVAALHEACGLEVLIITSGFDEVSGEAGPAEIDADQPGIPGIGDEYDEAA